MVAHVRKATVGAVTLENCRRSCVNSGALLVLRANGDLKDYQPRLHGSFRPNGQYRQRLAFCWLLPGTQQVALGYPACEGTQPPCENWYHRSPGMARSTSCSATARALWCHASTKLHYVRRQHPFAHVQLKDEDVSVDLSELNGPEDGW